MASRFWVGGTGTWDSSSTAHWGSSSGTVDNASVPGSSDTVTFDGSSGGGTVTLNFGGAITVQSITMGAFTGTWDNSVNNNNLTMTVSGTGFSGSGSGARTIKLGSATYTLSSTTTATWDFTTTTNLTLTASGATVAFTGGAATKNFIGGASQTWGTVTVAGASSTGRFSTSSAFTVGTLTITAPNFWILSPLANPTISTALGLAGSSSQQIGLVSNVFGSSASIAIPASQTAAWAAFRDITFTGNTLIASSSFDLGHNSGVTITPPTQAAYFSGGFFS